MKLAFGIIVILTLIDQGSKIWVRENVGMHEITPLLTNFLDLTFVENRGVSFSFLADLPDIIRLPLLIGISLIAVVWMIYYLVRHWNDLDSYMRFAFICIIPGALGNLIDRALLGAVTDFLHFRWYENSFFVNNLADCFISAGVVFFILSTLWGDKLFSKEERPVSSEAPSSNKEA